MASRACLGSAALLLTALAVCAILIAVPAAGEEGRDAGRGTVKNMVLWLHWDPTSPTVNGKATQLTFNTSQYWAKTNYTIDGDKNLVMDFYMVPVLASDLTVNGTVTVGFWGNYSGSNNNFQVQITFSERNSTGAENWTSTAFSANYNPASAPQYYSFDIPGFRHTFASGSTIHMSLQVSGGSGIYKAIYIDTATNNSRVVLPCENYLEVQSVSTFDPDGNPESGFQSNAPNTTAVIRATVTDPFGGYDIRWASCTLVGPSGATIIDNATMYRVLGTPVSFSSTYELAWNYSGADPGRYNITVWAVDNNGYYYYHYFMNYNYGPYAVSNSSFFFIGTPRFVNVLALDSTGQPLSGAEVQATVLERVVDRNLTGPAGLTNLSMQPGPYVFRVYWRGVRVASELVEVTDNVTELNPLVLYCRVYYPTFRTVDSRETPLEDAAVYVHYPNGSASILPFRTDASGEFSLYQTPAGPYRLSIVWGGVEVNRTVVVVDGNETYTIHTSVFYLSLRLVDPRGGSVPSAQVVVTDSSTGIVADSKLSDIEGRAVFRLAIRRYDLRVVWSDAVVNETASILVDGEMEMEVVCRIYYLTVRAVDSRGAPLESALCTVTGSGSLKVMGSGLSSPEGEVVVRVPTGLYNITVHWRDLPVYEAGDVDVPDDTTHVAGCRVHYLTIVTVDSRALPLESVEVRVSSVATGRILDSRRTGADGSLSSRLPAAELLIEASWHDVPVNRTDSFNLTGDGELVVRCSVHYLTISAVDDRDAPVEMAQVRIGLAGNGALLDARTTDYGGMAVSRLPAAPVSILVLWRDVVVNETPLYEVTGDDSLLIVCAVHYLDVLAVDSRGIPLDDAYIRVSLSDGKLVESLRTPQSGIVTVRVPAGPVNVSVTWLGVPVGSVTDHSVNASHLLTLRCSVYYLEVGAVDSRGARVEAVQLSAFRLLSGKLMGACATNESGVATFRLPADRYKLTAVWQDQLVSPDTDYELIADGSLTIKCLIHYLTVRPVDSRGRILENATVVFRQELTGNVLDTGVTGADGQVTARLPVGRYTILITWRDVAVNETIGFELALDQSVTVQCRVFYLTVACADVDGVQLQGAEILVCPAGRPELATSLVSGADGMAVFRFPAQVLDIVVRWRGVEVGSAAHALDSDAALPVSCKVFYLTVKVFDRDGRTLEGVQLTVFTLRSGLAVDVADTALVGPSGRAIFRLPVGQYRVFAHLRTTYLLTPVDQTESRGVDLTGSQTLRITFDGYPIPVHTSNAFMTALLFALVVVALLAAMYYVYRRLVRRPGQSRPEIAVGEAGAAGLSREEERKAFPGEEELEEKYRKEAEGDVADEEGRGGVKEERGEEKEGAGKKELVEEEKGKKDGGEGKEGAGEKDVGGKGEEGVEDKEKKERGEDGVKTKEEKKAAERAKGPKEMEGVGKEEEKVRAAGGKGAGDEGAQLTREETTGRGGDEGGRGAGEKEKGGKEGGPGATRSAYTVETLIKELEKFQ
ncbi:MAG: hypothetical protein QXW06_02760 [Thermoplasmata archaeon]